MPNVHKITTKSLVDPAGGDVAIINVKDSSLVECVSVSGIKCSFFEISSTKIAAITPPSTAGKSKIQVKFQDDRDASCAIMYWSPIDENVTLCLERGNYVDGVWKDRSRYAHHFKDEVYHPSETEPRFDGLDTMLRGDSCLVTPASTLGSTTCSGDTYNVTIAFTMCGMSDSLAPRQGVIFADSASSVGAYVVAGQLRWYHWSNSENYVDVGTIKTNEWNILQVKCDNGLLTARLNGGLWTTSINVGGLAILSGCWRLAGDACNDGLNADVRVVLIDKVSRSDSHFDKILNWVTTRHGVKGRIQDLEITSIDREGDVARVCSRDLTNLRDIRVDSLSHMVTPAIMSHPLFDGMNDTMKLAMPVTSLLGGSGWTFSALLDCRALTSDAGKFENQTIFSESNNRVGLEVFRNGARLWQYNHKGDKLYEATVGGLENGLQVIQAKWTGSCISIRVNGSAWISTPLETIGGIGHFLIGTNRVGKTLFRGRIVEMFFSNTPISDEQLDLVLSDVSHTYGLKLDQVKATPFDIASLPLSAYFKPGNYKHGTWNGVASLGDSVGRNLTTLSGSPLAVQTREIGIKKIVNTPDFDGVNSRLTTATNLRNLLGSKEFSGWALVEADRHVGTYGSGFTHKNDLIVGTDVNAYFAVTAKRGRVAHVRAISLDGTPVEISTRLDQGWNLLQWYFDGSKLRFRSNGKDWSYAAFTGLHALALDETLAVGVAPYSSHGFDGRVAELALADVSIGSKGCDDILAYVNQTYGLFLGDCAPFDFDPKSLSLSLYCKAGDYAPTKWLSTPSLGDSETRDLSEQSHYPSVSLDEAIWRMPIEDNNVSRTVTVVTSNSTKFLSRAIA